LHEENLARQEELKKELDQTRQQRDKELAKAKEEAERIMKEAKAKSERLSADLDSHAKEEAQRIIDQAKDNLEKTEKSLMSRHNEDALELAVRMLQYTFTDQGKEALQHQLISELIDEVKNLQNERFTAKTKDINVVSASALSDEERKKLTQILSDKIGIEVKLSQEQDPAIIAGMIVNIGALVIDGSLRSKLKKVTPYLKEIK
jgi:F0F1-type ATP synthase delta subunit